MDKGLILGVDIGGSHVSSALVNITNGAVVQASFCKEQVDARANSRDILDQWVKALTYSLSKSTSRIKGVGIAMPGPFDYDKGISLIRGVNKYEKLYGLNIKELLKKRLHFADDLPIHFENDAVCFGLGENLAGAAAQCKRVVALTLGTGLGSTFIVNGQGQENDVGVPPKGYLYNVPFKDGIAEDYISTAWLVNRFNAVSSQKVCNAKEIYELAIRNDQLAIEVFQTLGKNLGECLLPWLKAFKAECLIIGGNLGKASSLFLPEVKALFEQQNLRIHMQISNETELSAIVGVASVVQQKVEKGSNGNAMWRKANQPLMPIHTNEINLAEGKYNMYPFTPLGSNKIFSGFESLAQWMGGQKLVLIDGYVGVDWNMIVEKCSLYFQKHKIRVIWHHTSAFQKKTDDIESMVAPFLGEPGSVWGNKTTLSLEDFYQSGRVEELSPNTDYDLNIIIGPGAALSGWEAAVVYVDLPKNELQYRMQVGSITNLGASKSHTPTEMYKRFYFVDWVVLNKHRRSIKERLVVIADGQWRENISWGFHSAIKNGLQYISQTIIRARPWFAPGAWGGQWLKNNIPGLNLDEVNYAWSFELIVPENGLVFESDTNLLEVSFDWLMEQAPEAILGRDAGRFGTEFPIRFDFLDTFDGGNLSIQCHPSLSYIQKQFGENLTQDETYYILDSKENAQVYLGFQENIDPAEFRTALEKSHAENIEVDIEQYVQKFPSRKHDLFLIPNGTVHSSATNNLVLEISATPYIFTFKMYDWLCLDLNGEPRPINIDHAFKNLDFSRKGKRVEDELISKPVVLEKNENFQLIHLPTHKDHFYDIHRIEFLDEACIETHNQCHVLMLVEGDSVLVQTKSGDQKVFHYAETFIIPAAAHSYRLINQGDKVLKVIKAFVK